MTVSKSTGSSLLGILHKRLTLFLGRPGDHAGENGTPPPSSLDPEYDQWISRNSLTKQGAAAIRESTGNFSYRPLISLVMPVYDIDRSWLEKAVDSVLNQLYDNWELCIVDDGSTRRHVWRTLKKYARRDSRIRIRRLEKNEGISGASNAALHLAGGEFVGLIDHDDELSPDALYENVKLLNSHPEADLIYSDEDKMDTEGRRSKPFFKPDFSPDYLRSCNYICHFSLFRKKILDDIGGFRRGYEGAQDHDLILRFIEKTRPEKIFHIPRLLYHWRITPGSAALSAQAKPSAPAAGRKALADHLTRSGISGKVVDGLFPVSYRVIREIDRRQKVSIIIPFRDHPEILERCVGSVLEKSTYDNYDLILVNNGSEDEGVCLYLDRLKGNRRVRVLDFPGPFNFSAINNYAVSRIDSEQIILLNNDTEIITPGWIEALLEHSQREEVGAVGALLYYPDETVQHGGVIIGMKRIAGHSHRHKSRKATGYFGRLKTIQNYSAVTAACLMTRKAVFEEVGGFDENYSHAFNDIDFCLKIRERGWLIVYTPYAELYHLESFSRGIEDMPLKKERFNREVLYFESKWGELLQEGDPYYNPNLTLSEEDFSLKT